MTRSAWLPIVALAELPDQDFELVIAQGTFTVRFNDPPYVITSLRSISDPDGAELYNVVLNLFMV